MGEEIISMSITKPIILRSGSYTVDDIDALRNGNRVWEESDVFRAQLIELFGIRHPELSQAKVARLSEVFYFEVAAKDPRLAGDWVYFPWSGRLVHMISEVDYSELRTNRNKNLITAEEQKRLEQFVVGVVGLSVGASIATSLMYSGVGKRMKLAEHDTLATTNLNRLRARVDQIGKTKLTIVAEQLYEINPYAELTLFPTGLSAKTVDSFLDSTLKPQLIFEICDDFMMKVQLRRAARMRCIPVIMLTNIGDVVLIDVERFDQEPTRPLFHGAAAELEDRSADLSAAEQREWAVRLVGEKNIPTRARESVRELGKTLVGRPQLMSSVTLSGGIAAYCARQIALDQQFPSGRYRLSLPDIVQ